MSDELETFYERWQHERADLVEFDNACAARKIDAILRGAPALSSLNLKSAIDFGCGRGKALRHFCERLQLERAHGFDFSAAAIDYAASRFGSDAVRFHRLTTLDIDANIESIKAVIADKVDCVLLLDLLEHVADCKHLVARLSEVATYFVIKLPVESNILSNYVLRNKEYPSAQHYNGHLREFNANSVFYFIRELGLTPLAEALYLYDSRDIAPQEGRRSVWQSIKHETVAAASALLSMLLHKKLFIAVCGPGGYYCVATFNKANVLNP